MPQKKHKPEEIVAKLHRWTCYCHKTAAEGPPDRSRTTTGLNPENPNRNNRPEHG